MRKKSFLFSEKEEYSQKKRNILKKREDFSKYEKYIYNLIDTL